MISRSRMPPPQGPTTVSTQRWPSLSSTRKLCANPSRARTLISVGMQYEGMMDSLESRGIAFGVSQRTTPKREPWKKFVTRISCISKMQGAEQKCGVLITRHPDRQAISLRLLTNVCVEMVATKPKHDQARRETLEESTNPGTDS